MGSVPKELQDHVRNLMGLTPALRMDAHQMSKVQFVLFCLALDNHGMFVGMMMVTTVLVVMTVMIMLKMLFMLVMMRMMLKLVMMVMVMIIM